MKSTATEQSMSRNKLSHERQNNNNKEETETSLHYKSRPLGDTADHPNFDTRMRTPDSVSCWGDVPKRDTRLHDIITDLEQESLTNSRSFQQNNAIFRHSNRASQPILQTNSGRSYSSRLKQSLTNSQDGRPSNDDVNNVSNVAEPNTNSSSNTNNNHSGGATGREKLLEWLRLSQAKRDENNRQVFTRWIDRVDSLANSDSMTISLTSVNGAATSNLMDISTGAVLAPPSTLPGVLTAPTFVIGNPIGMMAQNMANFTKAGQPYGPQISAASVPTLFTGKSNSMNHMSFTPNLGSYILTVSPSTGGFLDGLQSEKGSNVPSDSASVSSDFTTTQSTGIHTMSATVAPSLVNTSAGMLHSASDTSNTTHSTASNSSSAGTHSGNTTTTANSQHNGLTTHTFNTTQTDMNTPTLVSPTTQPYYFPMPTINDPLCSQLYYYCYYQNQPATALTSNGLSPHAHLQTTQQATGAQTHITKPSPGYTPPLVYFMPTPNPHASLTTNGQQVFPSESCVCMPAYPTLTEQQQQQHSYENSARQPSNGLPDSSEAILYSTMLPYHMAGNDLSNGTNGNCIAIDSLRATPTNVSTSLQKSSGIKEADGSNTSSSAVVGIASDTVTLPAANPFNFDVTKWYAALREISSTVQLAESAPNLTSVGNTSVHLQQQQQTGHQGLLIENPVVSST